MKPEPTQSSLIVGTSHTEAGIDVPLRILLLEDNPLDAELAQETLISEGVACQARRVETRADYLTELQAGDYDLILADYSLPSFDGLSALSLARQLCPDVPFILISGRMGEEIAIEALHSGATDYVLKQGLARLTPAVRRALREAQERAARHRAEEALRQTHDELERLVQERTADLAQSNEALQAKIAQYRRAEERLREQANLLDHAQEAILVRDLEGRLLFWNRGAQRLYGWSAEETLGRKSQELFNRENAAQLEVARKTLDAKGEWSGELNQVTKEGNKIIVESRWTLVRDDTGQPKSILVINTDVTEKKKLEEQFLRTQRLESLGTLASGIAHDLNNILSPLLMAIHLLETRVTDEGSQNLLKMLRSNTERGGNMVKQILTFARGMQGERIPLQVKHLMKEIIRIIKDTFPKSVKITFNIPEDLWPIVGDATQLSQVLMNLCVNARDAMPQGGQLMITAENTQIDETYARMHLEAKPGRFVVISVADSGMGIPPEIIHNIFEPFFTTKELGQGTGLGLSTTLGIVKSHSGFINVYSEVGQGTQFKVYLPAAEATQPVATEPAMPALPTGQGEWILVVDDEAAILEITKTTLQSYGYNVLTAGDGAEAIALYATHKEQVKIVLTDMMMPYVNGPATIRALQKMNPGVKIIAASGLAASGKAIESAQAGVNTFLQKPYTAERLLTTIAEILRES